MKYLFFVLTIFVVSCGSPVERHESEREFDLSDSDKPEKNVVTNDIETKQIFREDTPIPLVIHIITYRGHEYMLARKNEAGGLIHLDDCKSNEHINHE